MRATVLPAETKAPGAPASKLVSLKWKLLCVAVTVLAVYFIFRRVPVGTLFETLKGMKVGWFLCAVILYGVMFLPAAWRWHLALRVNDCIVNSSATIRFSLIGHFFYLS